MSTPFTYQQFLWRWLFATVLVFGTYNPTRFSYFKWVFTGEHSFGPVVALIGVILLIGWIIYLRATFLSLGWLGIILGTALFACVIWLLVDLKLLSINSANAFSWVALILISLLLALGMSWSHIRRRLTGQIDTDDLDDGRA